MEDIVPPSKKAKLGPDQDVSGQNTLSENQLESGKFLNKTKKQQLKFTYENISYIGQFFMNLYLNVCLPCSGASINGVHDVPGPSSSSSNGPFDLPGGISNAQPGSFLIPSPLFFIFFLFLCLF